MEDEAGSESEREGKITNNEEGKETVGKRKNFECKRYL